MSGKYSGFWLLFCLLAACSPKELPVPAREKGSIETGQLEMGANYDYQVFYSLKDNKVVSRSPKLAWDLGFEAAEDGFRVILNTSKLMYAFATNATQFPADTAGFAAGKRFDQPSGHPDSTAIGDWRTHRPVYIIDRGVDLDGRPIGHWLLKLDSVERAGYHIRYKQLGTAQEASLFIPKNNAYSFTYFSFEGGGQIVEIAPPKADWDIYFTQYSVTIPIPYLVTGALLNPYQTMGAADSLLSFSEIDAAYVDQLPLSAAQDVIGYSWKTFDFGTGQYQVDPSINYILEASDGSRYKLHFIDFYNDAGVKGSPKWEVFNF